MTSRMTKARNFSAKSGSSLLTAERCRRRLTCAASLPRSREGSLCRAFNLPIAWVQRNRSANMWTIAASILSMLSRRSRRLEMGSAVSTIILSRTSCLSPLPLVGEVAAEPTAMAECQRRTARGHRRAQRGRGQQYTEASHRRFLCHFGFYLGGTANEPKSLNRRRREPIAPFHQYWHALSCCSSGLVTSE